MKVPLDRIGAKFGDIPGSELPNHSPKGSAGKSRYLRSNPGTVLANAAKPAAIAVANAANCSTRYAGSTSLAAKSGLGDIMTTTRAT